MKFNSYFANELEKVDELIKDDLITDDGSKLCLSKYGEYFARHIAFIFDKYY